MGKSRARRAEEEGAEALSSASDVTLGGSMRAQDRAPLSWTNEGADTFFRLRLREEGSGYPSATLASGASNQKLREQHQNSASPTSNVPDSSRLCERDGPIEMGYCLGEDTIWLIPRRNVGDHDRSNTGGLADRGGLWP